MSRVCLVPGCGATHYGKGLCVRHYRNERNRRIAERDRAAMAHTKGASVSAPTVLDAIPVPAFPQTPNFAPSTLNPNPPAPVPAFPVPVFPKS